MYPTPFALLNPHQRPVPLVGRTTALVPLSVIAKWCLPKAAGKDTRKPHAQHSTTNKCNWGSLCHFLLDLALLGVQTTLRRNTQGNSWFGNVACRLTAGAWQQKVRWGKDVVKVQNSVSKLAGNHATGCVDGDFEGKLYLPGRSYKKHGAHI